MKKILCGILVLWAVAGFGGNLIQNSDVDLALMPEFKMEGKADCYKFSQFTEDLTWNKCGKLEIVSYIINKNGQKSVNCGIVAGGEKGLAGFPAKPNTIYKFSVELKGTVKRAFINATEWIGGDYYKDMKKLNSNVGVVRIQPEWVCYKGTFKTGPDAKRAALYISIWGSEADKDLPDSPGEYLLIDKVNIEEQTDVLDAGSVKPVAVQDKSLQKKIFEAAKAASTPQFDGKLDDPAWNSALKVGGFVDLVSGKPAKTGTEVVALTADNALWLGIKCQEPAMDKLHAAVTGEGQNVWKDDVIEIFFDPVIADRNLSQFVVAAGGGRWMGFGGSSDVKHYGEWEAKVDKTADGWTAEVKIPFSLLGWNAAPADGTMVGFNLCRQRTPEKELSSWSWGDGSFHNRKGFGSLVIGSFQGCVDTALKDIDAELAALPESDGRKSAMTEAEALKKINKPGLSSAAMESVFYRAEKLKAQIKYLKAGDRKFVLSAISPVADMAIPLLPEEITKPQDNISIRSAINEFKPLPLAVTNLTGGAEEYRVIIFKKLEDGIEQPGLSGQAGDDFPADKITLLRGVRVKDGDGSKHGQRFDPLVTMDSSYTVLVPPRESGVVWAIFDCRGVKAGKYTGFIRVIPLNEPAKYVQKQGWKYEGPMLDMPLELEVLPVELSKAPAIPLMLFREAGNEHFFKAMIEHDIRIFQLSPWYFDFKFNTDGSLVDASLPKVDKILKDYREWAQKYGVEKEIRFMIGFSAYNVFVQEHAKNKFKYGSPEWKRAWQSWIRGVADVMRRNGVNEADYTVEIWDEPHRTDDAAVVETCRLAKEAVPQMRLQLTLGASMQPVDILEKIAPYVDDWCFWSDYLARPEYLTFWERLKAAQKHVWIYNCDTNMRADLYRYYRRHAWTGLNYGADTIALFYLLVGPGGHYGVGSWKTDPFGGVAYRSFDHCITSVRFECLRIGSTDLKYMAKLAEVAAAAKAAGVAPELVRDAEKLLKEGPYKMAVSHAHDTAIANSARDEAVKLIMQLQAKNGK